MGAISGQLRRLTTAATCGDTATRTGSDVLDGRFLVELAACENAETGKAIEWPPAPLTLRGSFAGLPHGRP